ncbi:kinase-like protein, partial [Setomelanomma holmii]
QPAQSDISSIVRDAGYSLPLSDIAEDRPPEQSLDLAEIGTQFPSNDTSVAKPIQKSNYLETELRNGRVESAERKDLEFLPIDQLERIMTYESIYQELQRAGLEREQLHESSASLCRRRELSRQRIFAVLCMLQMPALIVEFEQEGIFDSDLPFIFKKDAVYREIVADSKRARKKILSFQSTSWQPLHLESFERYQYQVAAPIFKLSWLADEKVLHFALKERLVLPFMHAEDTSPYGNLGTTVRREGGTSIVRRVKIHKAHFNASPDTRIKEDVYFAVKELDVSHGSDRTHGEKEDRALKRFNAQSHPHLIRLLATYTYESRFHLIFPWANGNLKDLWMAPSHQLLPGDHHNLITIRWMSAQILGLAKALQIIHDCPVDKDNVQGLSLDERKKRYGRHGDLKPENILWFKGDQANGPTGILQIADFGFADFHSKHSRSHVRRSAVGGITDTYKAPEYDVSPTVSPQYDIWSFGCILLQFVVWYMRGWRGVDDFSMARSAESRGSGAPIATDIFFGLEPSGTSRFKARAKASVAAMCKTLKEDRTTCSDYVLDLLDYIQINLLRVDSFKRDKIDVIVERLGKMDNVCHQLDKYCMVRTREGRRTPSGLSEVIEVAE